MALQAAANMRVFRGRRLGKQARTEERFGYLFISPWLIGFLVFHGGPIVASMAMSLAHYDIINPLRWAGLGNYIGLVQDELFWISLKATVNYALATVGVGILAAFAVALLLNRDVVGLSFWRTLFYLPSIISGVAVSLLWMWIFQKDFGILNQLLWQFFHIEGPGWFSSDDWVIPSLMIMSLWSIGGGIIIYLARLQSIPTELYEAAEIDGAGPWRKLRAITIPLMTPVIFFQLIMGIIGSFQVFTVAFVVTSGRPTYAWLFYVLYLYRNAFEYYKMGYAAAMAWVLFLILLMLTASVFRTAKHWVYYEAE
jgi:multiple sugar transport system permease protein